MAKFHPNLTQEKWNSFSKDKQVLNIASEFLRARNSLIHNESDYFINSLNRALELIDLTISDKKWKDNLLLPIRLREETAKFYITKRTDDISVLYNAL